MRAAHAESMFALEGCQTQGYLRATLFCQHWRFEAVSETLSSVEYFSEPFLTIFISAYTSSVHSA